MLGIDPKIARTAWSQAAVFAGVVLLVGTVWVIRKTILEFAIALMLAYLVYPLVHRCERRISKKARIAAVILPFALIIGLVSGLGLLVKGPLISEVDKLHDQILKQEQGQSAFRQEVMNWKPWGLPVGEQIVEAHVVEQMRTAAPGLRKAFEVGFQYLGNIVIVPILSFLILKDGRRIRDGLLNLFGHRKLVETMMMDAHELLLEYMRALLLLCLAVLISFSTVLTLMQVKYALLLSVVAFALEFIPLVGPLISAATVILVSEFNHYQHLGWLILFLIGYRLFQDYFLSPQLMHRGVNLNPLLILFGVFAGAEIGGVPGMFLSVPILALIRLVYYEVRKNNSPMAAAAAQG